MTLAEKFIQESIQQGIQQGIRQGLIEAGERSHAKTQRRKEQKSNER